MFLAFLFRGGAGPDNGVSPASLYLSVFFFRLKFHRRGRSEASELSGPTREDRDEIDVRQQREVLF